MNAIPFYRCPNTSKPAKLTIARVRDGKPIWTVLFNASCPIPAPPLDLEMYGLWGGVHIVLEWDE